MVLASIPISLPIVPVSTVSMGFSFIYGYYLLSQAHPRLSEFKGKKSELSFGQGLDKAINEILSVGTLMFFSLLPWVFIGLKNESSMALILLLTLSLQAVSSVVIITTFVNRFNCRPVRS